MRGRLSFCFLGLVLLLCFTLLANVGCTKKENSPLVFQRQGWVSDYADALKPEEKSRISQELEAYEKETCHQIYLLIIPSLAGENITDFSQRTAAAWKIGQTGLDNGFLITIAMQERNIRIEATSAFEWFIQNGTGEKILREEVIPLFRENRFVDGIERGLKEIMKAGRLKQIPDDLKPDICRH